jgi:mono/diheme cytochrome c family protein
MRIPLCAVSLAVATLMLTGSGARAEDAAGDKPTGSSANGAAVFAARRCYICHGSTGQTGLRRIVPMSWPQQTFVQFVQHSTLAAMPSFPDMSASDLADLYAFLRSIPIDAPAVKDTPLLREVQEQAAQKPHKNQRQ